MILLGKGPARKPSPRPGPGRRSLCLAGDTDEDDSECTWAGPWPPAASHAHLGRTQACELALPSCPAKARNGQMKGFSHHADLLLHQFAPVSVSGTFRRKRSRSSGCAVSFPEGREGSQPRRSAGRRERAAVCPGAEQTLEPLSGQRGRPLARWRAAGERGIPGLSPQPLPRPRPHPHPCSGPA